MTEGPRKTGVGTGRESYAAFPRKVEGVHPYIFDNPVRAIREALKVIEADRENLFHQVEELSAAVNLLRGPM